MTWLKTFWSKFFGLFVDDWNFAVAIFAWLTAAWLILPQLGLLPILSPAILFAGLVVILVKSATRRACGSNGG